MSSLNRITTKVQYYESRGEGYSGLIRYEHPITVSPEPAIKISINSFSNKLYTQPDVFFQALIANVTDRKLLLEELNFISAHSGAKSNKQGSSNLGTNTIIPPKIKLNSIMPMSKDISMSPNETFSAIISVSKEMDLLVS
jgi:hypothetical protein